MDGSFGKSSEKSGKKLRRFLAALMVLSLILLDLPLTAMPVMAKQRIGNSTETETSSVDLETVNEQATETVNEPTADAGALEEILPEDSDESLQSDNDVKIKFLNSDTIGSSSSQKADYQKVVFYDAYTSDSNVEIKNGTETASQSGSNYNITADSDYGYSFYIAVKYPSSNISYLDEDPVTIVYYDFTGTTIDKYTSKKNELGSSSDLLEVGKSMSADSLSGVKEVIADIGEDYTLSKVTDDPSRSHWVRVDIKKDFLAEVKAKAKVKKISSDSTLEAIDNNSPKCSVTANYALPNSTEVKFEAKGNISLNTMGDELYKATYGSYYIGYEGLLKNIISGSDVAPDADKLNFYIRHTDEDGTVTDTKFVNGEGITLKYSSHGWYFHSITEDQYSPEKKSKKVCLRSAPLNTTSEDNVTVADAVYLKDTGEFLIDKELVNEVVKDGAIFVIEFDYSETTKATYDISLDDDTYATVSYEGLNEDNKAVDGTDVSMTITPKDENGFRRAEGGGSSSTRATRRITKVEYTVNGGEKTTITGTGLNEVTKAGTYTIPGDKITGALKVYVTTEEEIVVLGDNLSDYIISPTISSATVELTGEKASTIASGETASYTIRAVKGKKLNSATYYLGDNTVAGTTTNVGEDGTISFTTPAVKDTLTISVATQDDSETYKVTTDVNYTASATVKEANSNSADPAEITLSANSSAATAGQKFYFSVEPEDGYSVTRVQYKYGTSGSYKDALPYITEPEDVTQDTLHWNGEGLYCTQDKVSADLTIKLYISKTMTVTTPDNGNAVFKILNTDIPKNTTVYLDRNADFNFKVSPSGSNISVDGITANLYKLSALNSNSPETIKFDGGSGNRQIAKNIIDNSDENKCIGKIVFTVATTETVEAPDNAVKWTVTEESLSVNPDDGTKILEADDDSSGGTKDHDGSVISQGLLNEKLTLAVTEKAAVNASFYENMLPGLHALDSPEDKTVSKNETDVSSLLLEDTSASGLKIVEAGTSLTDTKGQLATYGSTDNLAQALCKGSNKILAAINVSGKNAAGERAEGNTLKYTSKLPISVIDHYSEVKAVTQSSDDPNPTFANSIAAIEAKEGSMAYIKLYGKNKRSGVWNGLDATDNDITADGITYATNPSMTGLADPAFDLSENTITAKNNKLPSSNPITVSATVDWADITELNDSNYTVAGGLKFVTPATYYVFKELELNKGVSASEKASDTGLDDATLAVKGDMNFATVSYHVYKYIGSGDVPDIGTADTVVANLAAAKKEAAKTSGATLKDVSSSTDFKYSLTNSDSSTNIYVEASKTGNGIFKVTAKSKSADSVTANLTVSGSIDGISLGTSDITKFTVLNEKAYKTVKLTLEDSADLSSGNVTARSLKNFPEYAGIDRHSTVLGTITSNPNNYGVAIGYSFPLVYKGSEFTLPKESDLTDYRNTDIAKRRTLYAYEVTTATADGFSYLDAEGEVKSSNNIYLAPGTKIWVNADITITAKWSERYKAFYETEESGTYYYHGGLYNGNVYDEVIDEASGESSKVYTKAFAYKNSGNSSVETLQPNNDETLGVGGKVPLVLEMSRIESFNSSNGSITWEPFFIEKDLTIEDATPADNADGFEISKNSSTKVTTITGKTPNKKVELKTTWTDDYGGKWVLGNITGASTISGTDGPVSGTITVGTATKLTAKIVDPSATATVLSSLSLHVGEQIEEVNVGAALTKNTSTNISGSDLTDYKWKWTVANSSIAKIDEGITAKIDTSEVIDPSKIAIIPLAAGSTTLKLVVTDPEGFTSEEVSIPITVSSADFTFELMNDVDSKGKATATNAYNSTTKTVDVQASTSTATFIVKLKDKNGKDVTGSATFKVEGSDGSIISEVTFNAAQYVDSAYMVTVSGGNKISDKGYITATYQASGSSTIYAYKIPVRVYGLVRFTPNDSVTTNFIRLNKVEQYDTDSSGNKTPKPYDLKIYGSYFGDEEEEDYTMDLSAYDAVLEDGSQSFRNWQCPSGTMTDANSDSSKYLIKRVAADNVTTSPWSGGILVATPAFGTAPVESIEITGKYVSGNVITLSDEVTTGKNTDKVLPNTAYSNLEIGVSPYSTSGLITVYPEDLGFYNLYNWNADGTYSGNGEKDSIYDYETEAADDSLITSNFNTASLEITKGNKNDNNKTRTDRLTIRKTKDMVGSTKLLFKNGDQKTIKTMTLHVNGAKYVGGFVSYYWENGSKVKSAVRTINEKEYFFDENGNNVMFNGDSDKPALISDTGVIVTLSDGNKLLVFKTVTGNTTGFGTPADDGIQEFNSKRYFIETVDGQAGVIARNCVVTDPKTKKRYIAGSDGALLTDQKVTLNESGTNNIYWLDSQGEIICGDGKTLTTQSDGKKYCIATDGKVLTSQIVTDSSGDKYIAGADGAIAEGQIAIGDSYALASLNSKNYLIDKDGKILTYSAFKALNTDSVTVNSVKYLVNENDEAELAEKYYISGMVNFSSWPESWRVSDGVPKMSGTITVFSSNGTSRTEDVTVNVTPATIASGQTEVTLTATAELGSYYKDINFKEKAENQTTTKTYVIDENGNAKFADDIYVLDKPVFFWPSSLNKGEIPAVKVSYTLYSRSQDKTFPTYMATPAIEEDTSNTDSKKGVFKASVDLSAYYADSSLTTKAGVFSFTKTYTYGGSVDPVDPDDPDDPDDPGKGEEVRHEDERPEGTASNMSVTYTIEEPLIYDGNAKTLKNLQVFWTNSNGDKYILTEGKEYSVKYTNNKNAGNGYVTITGKGSYTNTIKIPLTISPRNISASGSFANEFTVMDISADSYSKINRTKPKLFWKGKSLSYNRDYTASVSGSDDDYSYTVKGVGNFTGTRKINTYVVEKSMYTDLSKLKLSIDKNTIEKISKDEVILPAFTVSAGYDTTVVYPDESSGSFEIGEASLDYRFEGNDRAGKAYLVLTASEPVYINGKTYYGSKTVQFNISPNIKFNKDTVKLKTDPSDIYFTGFPQIIEVEIEDDGNSLEEGSDYKISYKNNVKAGKATATITGLGAYDGNKYNLPFTIVKPEICFDQTSLESEYGLNKGGALITNLSDLVKVKVNGEINEDMYVDAGVDYSISYSSNKKVGDRALATIKGKGNYSGSDSCSFYVAYQELTEEKVYAKKVEVSYKADKSSFEALTKGKKPVLIELASGKTLTAGKDFVFEWQDNGDEWDNDTGYLDIDVEITPMGDYSGDSFILTGALHVYRQSSATKLSANMFRVEDKDYTASAVTLEESDIDTDVKYEIIPGSYKKNINAGTASVQVQGLEEYGGVATIKFKILKSDFSE